MAQWSDDMPKSSMVASSNPKSATAKKKQKTSSVSSQQILRGSGQKFIQAGDKQSYHAGIAQRQSVYNIVGHNLRLPRVRKTDGYRLISGRSQDRNLLPASIPIRLLYRSSPSQLSDVKTQHMHDSSVWSNWQYAVHLGFRNTRSNISIRLLYRSWSSRWTLNESRVE